MQRANQDFQKKPPSLNPTHQCFHFYAIKILKPLNLYQHLMDANVKSAILKQKIHFPRFVENPGLLTVYIYVYCVMFR